LQEIKQNSPTLQGKNPVYPSFDIKIETLANRLF
jgi:hypothetical protein